MTTITAWALVPARAGSKGVPGKNAKRLGDRPLVAHTIDAALRTHTVRRVIVSTDGDDIADAARGAGADVPFARPPQLALDDTPMQAVIAHALEWAGHQREPLPSICVLLQPTVPFRNPAHIDAIVHQLARTDCDAVVSVSPVPAGHHAAWQLSFTPDGVLSRLDGRGLASLPTRRQDLPPAFYRDGSVYAFRTEAFVRTGSIYGERTGAWVSESVPVNIDSLDDWRQAEDEWRRRAHP